MINNIRLVAMDIDGTLIGKTKKMSNYTRRVLNQAGEHGIVLVIASGRALKAIPETLFNIEGMMYAITSNGSSIFRLSDQKRIYGIDLMKEQIEYLLEVYKHYQCPMEVFIEGKAYTSIDYYEHLELFGASQTAVEYVHTTRKPVDDLYAFVSEHAHHIEGINYIVADAALKKIMREELERRDNLYVTSSVPRYIEVSHGDVCKRNAIQWLANNLNISRDEIAAFGDSENDVEMIEYAGYGVAMENGSELLKNVSDYVAPAVDDDGVAHVIKEFF